MKEQLISLINSSLEKLTADFPLINQGDFAVAINPCKNPEHGDYASNCALVLAKRIGVPPRDLAQKIINHLPENGVIQKIDIAGPGFINFFITAVNIHAIIPAILQEGGCFGRSTEGHGQRIHMEYVSANPTGPLHVGHGRGAAFGASVANLLKEVGYDVHREYYVNDIGRQMQILAFSTWIRYLQLQNEEVLLPASAYQGDYIIDIAKDLVARYEGRFHHTQESLESALNDANILRDDPEKYLDGLVMVAHTILGKEDFSIIQQVALQAILADIREDLAEFGVTYDQWFHEGQLEKDGLIQAAIQLLDEHGYVYEKGGARWFRATQFGDDKDRVIVRSNGKTTYFTSDVAYHLYKYRQGYDQVIDVFGADHHGYIGRIRGFLQGLRQDPNKVRILLVQFAILYRGKEKISMSTRKGEFVTLRELRHEVGNDAARFFYIMRKPEQHLDFDLELAKSQSSDNPVYYIQYAHARIHSVWQQLSAKQLQWDKPSGLDNLSLLSTKYEKDLLSALNRYPDLIKTAAKNCEPHMLAHYLFELASLLHAYYNAEKFIVEEVTLRNARLCLIAAVQQVLVNGLRLLGVSAPEKM